MAKRPQDPKYLGMFGVFLFFLVTFVPAIPSLGLLIDDWYYVNAAFNYNWQELFLEWFRPAEPIPWLGSRFIFGLAIPGYYAVSFAMQTVSAVLVFLIFAELVPGHLPFAFAVAILFAVYPTDQTRLWLGTFVYRQAMCLLLLSTYLATLSVSRGRTSLHLISLICYGLAVLSNETCLPFFVLPALAYTAAARLTLGQWARRSVPYLLISLLYLAGRAFVVTAFQQYDRLSEVWRGISLGRIALRVWRVFGLNFGQAWKYALGRAAEQGFRPALMAGAGVGVFAVVSLFFSCWTASQGAKVNARASSRWVWFGLFLVGLFLLLLGYVVLIPIAVSISIGGIDSRVNSAATLGAALALCSLVKLGSEIVSSRKWLASLIFLVLMGGSIGLASAHHYAIWQDYASAWQIQKGIWRSMLALAPSFADDSYVLITGLPRPQGIIGPLNTVWEVTAALRLLYDNRSLRGDILWEGELGGIGQDAAEYRIRFLADGFMPRRSEEIISYERLVLFEFVPSDRLRLIEGAPPWAPPSIPALRTNPAQVRMTPGYSPARDIIGL